MEKATFGLENRISTNSTKEETDVKIQQAMFDMHYLHQHTLNQEALTPGQASAANKIMLFIMYGNGKPGRANIWKGMTMAQARKAYLTDEKDWLAARDEKVVRRRGCLVNVLAPGTLKVMRLFLSLPGMDTKLFLFSAVFKGQGETIAKMLQCADKIYYGRICFYGTNLWRKMRSTSRKVDALEHSRKLGAWEDGHQLETEEQNYVALSNDKKAVMARKSLAAEVSPVEFPSPEQMSTMKTVWFAIARRMDGGISTEAIAGGANEMQKDKQVKSKKRWIARKEGPGQKKQNAKDKEIVVAGEAAAASAAAAGASPFTIAVARGGMEDAVRAEAIAEGVDAKQKQQHVRDEGRNKARKEATGKKNQNAEDDEILAAGKAAAASAAAAGATPFTIAVARGEMEDAVRADVEQEQPTASSTSRLPSDQKQVYSLARRLAALIGKHGEPGLELIEKFIASGKPFTDKTGVRWESSMVSRALQMWRQLQAVAPKKAAAIATKLAAEAKAVDDKEAAVVTATDADGMHSRMRSRSPRKGKVTLLDSPAAVIKEQRPQKKLQMNQSHEEGPPKKKGSQPQTNQELGVRHMNEFAMHGSYNFPGLRNRCITCPG